MNKIYFKSKDGTKLCGIWHVPDKPTNKAVILAHGITDSKHEGGLFVLLAEALVEKGYAVFRFDFRGHGESEGKQEETTITGELLDFETAVKETKKNYAKIGIVGASFGASIAILYTAKHQQNVHALSLWNPVLDYDHVFIHPFLPWLKDKKNTMERDLEEKGYLEIGSRNFRLGKNLFEEMKSIYPYKVLKDIVIPTLVLHGDADTYVPYADAATYTPTMKQGTFIALKDGRHGLQNRLDVREKTVKETVNFFESSLPQASI